MSGPFPCLLQQRLACQSQVIAAAAIDGDTCIRPVAPPVQLHHFCWSSWTQDTFPVLHSHLLKMSSARGGSVSISRPSLQAFFTPVEHFSSCSVVV